MSNQVELKGTADDGLWVQAIMYFPENEYLRRSWYASQYVMEYLSELDTNKAELNKSTLEILINAPSMTDLKNKTSDAVKKGVVIGDILSSIYLMEIFNMPEPSLNKARHIAKGFAKKNSYGDSSPMYTSEGKIKNILKEYKSVAHLWAAFRLNQAYPFTAHKNIFFEGLPDFLSVSKGLLDFGLDFVPYRARPKEPILNKQKAWFLPPEIQSSSLISSNYPDGLKELLEDYDATEYQY